MKNIIFISLLIGLLSAAHIQAQSYFYNKNASGLAVSYTRIAGINFAAVDYTYRGILSVGGTLALDNGREGYGINGILNLCKYLGSRSVFSLPIFIGSQSVNGNNAISFGVGAYSKMFSSETFSTAVGVSYSRTKVQNYFSDNYTGQFGVEVFLLYKDIVTIQPQS